MFLVLKNQTRKHINMDHITLFKWDHGSIQFCFKYYRERFTVSYENSAEAMIVFFHIINEIKKGASIIYDNEAKQVGDD